MNIVNRYKALLIDIGDTLVKIDAPFEAYTKKAFQNVYDFIQPGIEKEFFLNTAWNIRSSIRQHAHETLEEPSIHIFFDHLFNQLQIDINRAMYPSLEKAYVSAELDITSAFDEALHFLSEAKKNGLSLIAATNNFSPLHVQLVLQKFNFLSYFDALFISGEEGIRKPHQDFLKRLCAQQQLTKESCLMIGDKPHMDVAAANAIKMDNVWINRKQNTPSEKHIPTYTVNSLNELL